MKLTVAAAAFVAGLGLVACDQFAAGRELPPPPGPPVPPSPELPMTAAKARLIMGSLSTACFELATLKYEEALRSELRDLRWNLDKLPADEAKAQCLALTETLRKTPKPAVCW